MEYENKTYTYSTEKPKLFTEEGMALYTRVRDQTNKLLFQAGACTAEKVMRPISGSAWLMFAALDYMEESGDIKCVHQGYRSNDAVYIKGDTK